MYICTAATEWIPLPTLPPPPPLARPPPPMTSDVVGVSESLVISSLQSTVSSTATAGCNSSMLVGALFQSYIRNIFVM